MVTIVMSIRGRHIRSMRSGKKRVELRGTRPRRTEGPYRVLLCQSGTGGRIVAAFISPVVAEVSVYTDAELGEMAHITPEEVSGLRGRGGALYGWPVTAFVDLAAEGYASHVTDWGLDRAPQSWCYARWDGLPLPEI